MGSLREGGEDERADAGAADGDAGGEGAAAVEVVRHDDDGGHVAEREAEAREEPKEQMISQL